MYVYKAKLRSHVEGKRNAFYEGNFNVVFLFDQDEI